MAGVLELLAALTCATLSLLVRPLATGRPHLLSTELGLELVLLMAADLLSRQEGSLLAQIVSPAHGYHGYVGGCVRLGQTADTAVRQRSSKGQPHLLLLGLVGSP